MRDSPRYFLPSKSVFHFPMRRVFLILLLLTLSFVSRGASETLCFLYALDSDWDQLKGRSQSGIVRTVNIGEVTVRALRIGSHTVYGTKMGRTPEESAMNTAAAVTQARCSVLLSTGPAGSLVDSKKEGGVYFATSVKSYLAHKVESSTFPIALGDSHELSPTPSSFAHRLRDIAKSGGGVIVASGPFFVSGIEPRGTIQTVTGAELIDMNSIGLVKAAELFKLPLVILRVVSDRADRVAGTSFQKFVENYDGRMGAMVGEFLLHNDGDERPLVSHGNIRKLLDP